MAATNRLLIQVGQQGAKFLRFERHLGHVAAAADLIRLRAHVIRGTGKAVGALASYVEFGVLQQGLCRLERALVVGIVADHQFVEHRGARGPERQQHGQQHEHDDDEQRDATLAPRTGTVVCMKRRGANHGFAFHINPWLRNWNTLRNTRCSRFLRGGLLVLRVVMFTCVTPSQSV